MSVEGGIQGTQHKIVCPKCGKIFTAWRPDTEPGVKVKCYWCKTEVEDEAAKRVRAPVAPAPAADAPVPTEPAAAPGAVTAPGPVEN
ncbi:MAG: hypothetical protein ABJC07_01140 [Acidobacteriota bacterium]